MAAVIAGIVLAVIGAIIETWWHTRSERRRMRREWQELEGATAGATSVLQVGAEERE